MADIKQEKLENLANDRHLLNAISSVFEEAVKKEKPCIGDSDDNAILGEKYRAYELSKQIIDSVFEKIKSYKVDKTNKSTFNRGE